MGALAGEVRQLARVHSRLRMCEPWAAPGSRFFAALIARTDADEGLNWAVMVDSATVRTQSAHEAGTREKGPGTSPLPLLISDTVYLLEPEVPQTRSKLST